MDDGGTIDLRLECRRHSDQTLKLYTLDMESEWPKCWKCGRRLKLVRGRKPKNGGGQ